MAANGEYKEEYNKLHWADKMNALGFTRREESTAEIYSMWLGWIITTLDDPLQS